MKRYTVHAAKTQLSRLIDRALAGEDVIIARGQHPVVKLVPVNTPTPKRKFGVLRGKIKLRRDFFAPPTAEELALWEGE